MLLTFRIILLFLTVLCGLAFCGDNKNNLSANKLLLEQLSRHGFNLLSRHLFESDKFVVVIQDSHCDYLSQKELAGILENLNAWYGFRLIAVEGSKGEVSTALLSTFPIQSARAKVADDLLKKSMITGEEYFSIIKNPRITISGVDDETLYKRNVFFLNNFFAADKKISGILDSAKQGITSLKRDSFSPSIRELDNIANLYKKSNLTLTKFIDECFRLCPQASVLIKNSEHLNKTYLNLKKEQTVDYKLLNLQTKQLIDYIAFNSTKRSVGFQQNFKQLVLKRLLGKIDDTFFYMELNKTASILQIDIQNNYKPVAEYIEIQNEIHNSDKTELNESIELFIDNLYGILAKTGVDKKILDVDRRLNKLDKLISFSLTQKEYEGYFKNTTPALLAHDFIEKYNNLNLPFKIMPEYRNNIINLIENNLNFYRMASKRDVYLLKNTIELMDIAKENKAVLIAGGFHTASILRQCEEQKISCAVIAPKTASKVDFKTYASTILRSEQVSAQYGVVAGNLRASSFFAEHGFDDIKRINEFRDNFIFAAVLNSLNQFTYNEVYEIISQWREGFLNAVEEKHNKGSQEYRRARVIFDYIITNAFSFKNIKLDHVNKSLTIQKMGKTIILSKGSIPSVNIKLTPSDDAELNKAFGLKEDVIKLTGASVFISAWVVSSKPSPYFGQNDARYTVKYIEALNKRGITPFIIMPSNDDERGMALSKYQSETYGKDLKFQLVMLKSPSSISKINLDGKITGEIPLEKGKRPVIIQTISNADNQSYERINYIRRLFSSGEPQVLTPFFIRIPALGATINTGKSSHQLDLAFNRLAVGYDRMDTIETGLAIGQDSLSAIKKLRRDGIDKFRIDALLEISLKTGAPLFGLMGQIEGFGETNIGNLHFTIRYIPDKSDAELASFMKASSASAKKQVIFTFYNNSSSADLRHKRFIKNNFSLIDIKNPENNIINPQSRILVINLPILNNQIFKNLVLCCDTAILNSPDSFAECLAANKLGVGPLPILRPSVQDRFSVVTNMLWDDVGAEILNNLKNYAFLSGQTGSDYLDAWKPDMPLNELELFLKNIMFDEYTNSLTRSVLSESTPLVNGINTLTDIISKIDSGANQADILNAYNFPLQKTAFDFINTFMFDRRFKINSAKGQDDFIKIILKDFFQQFIVNEMLLKKEPEDIYNSLDYFKNALVDLYNLKVSLLDSENAFDLSGRFKKSIESLLSSFEMVSGGYLFIPADASTGDFFEYHHIDYQPFISSFKNYGQTLPVSEIISAETKKRLESELKDAEYVKKVLVSLNIRNMFDTWRQSLKDDALYKEFIPFYDGSNAQIDYLTEYSSLVCVDLLKGVANQNAHILIEKYGKADIKSLYEYITDLMETNPDGYSDSPVFKSLNEFRNMFTANFVDIVTEFFRYQDIWLKDLKIHLDDIIRQKMILGDYSLSVKSIGAATGQEPYSIAIVIENTLYKIASEEVFANIEDETLKKKLVERWIEKWDINIYAFDHVIPRLIAAKMGIFQNQDRLLFELNPELGRMFSYKTQSFKEKPSDTEYVIVKDRLRRWLKPVYCDLEKHPETILNTPSEISFMLNVLPYLNNRDDVLGMFLSSQNPLYKYFAIYNHEFGKNKVERTGILKAMPYSMKPLVMPKKEELLLFTASNNLHSIRDLERVYASYYTIIQDILNRDGVEIENITPFENVYDSRSVSIIDKFLTENIVSLSSDISQTLINEYVKKDIADLATRFLKVGAGAKDIEKQLSIYKTRLSSVYKNKLIEKGIQNQQNLTELFNKNLDSLIGSIKFAGIGHLFMPAFYAGQPVFEHYYLDSQEFSADPKKMGVVEIREETLSYDTTRALIQDLEDTQIAGLFLKDIKFKLDFSRVESYILPPNYTGSTSQIDVVTGNAGMSILHELRALASKYSKDLMAVYGEANLDSLYKFIKSDVFTESKPSLTAEYNKIIELLKITMNTNADEVGGFKSTDKIVNGSTAFFRDHENGWVEAFQKYINELIILKTSFGDFNITVKSIGSSIGKEAYSIAGVIQNQLINYASNNIYHSITDKKKQRRLAEQWVDLWNIKIYAYDSNIYRLAQAKEGVYMVYDNHAESSEINYFEKNPEMKSMFADILKGTEKPNITVYYAKINNRLRRWLIPVYCDLNGNIGVISDIRAEITFAKNIFMYLKPEPVQNIIRAVINNVSPLYKSYFDYVETRHINYYLSANPHLYKRFLYSHIIAPATRFDIDMIALIAQKNRIKSIYELAKIIGEDREDVKDILSNRQTAVNSGLGNKIYDDESILLIKRFISGRQPRFNSRQAQIEFVNQEIKPMVTDYIMNFIAIEMSAPNISRQMSLFKAKLVSRFKTELVNIGFSGYDQASTLFYEILSGFLDNIKITANGHAFIPSSVGDASSFNHTYIDYNEFSPIKKEQPIGKIITQTVHSETQKRMAAILDDAAAVYSFLTSKRYKLDFSGFLPIAHPPNYVDSNTQNEELTENISLILVNYFLKIAEKHSEYLTKKYGLPSVANLITEFNMDEFDASSPIHEDYIKLMGILFNNKDIKILATGNRIVGVTLFFRDFDTVWGNDFEKYLNELIIHKTAKGDYSITARSIGSSTGREAYSIAGMIEHTLQKYADKQLFAHIADTNIKQQAVNKWISQWDIKIYAFDLSLHRLAQIKEGVYELRPYENVFFEFHPEYKNIFKSIDEENANGIETTYAKVNDTIRNWVIPVYCNIDDNISPIADINAEITFSMNIFMYLKDVKSVLDTLINTVSPEYKSFFAYNEKTKIQQFNPFIKKLNSKEPYIIKPVKYPSVSSVLAVASSIKNYSADSLAYFFGLNIHQLNSVLNGESASETKINISFYKDKAEALVNMFYTGKRDIFGTTEGNNYFVEHIFEGYLINLIMDFAKIKASYHVVPEELLNLSVLIVSAYKDKLNGMGLPDAKRAGLDFENRLKSYLDSITIAGNCEAFIPFYFEGKALYRRFFIDNHPFAVSENERGVFCVENEVVPQETKDRMVSALNDLIYVQDLLEYLQSDSLVKYLDELKQLSDAPFTIISSDQQREKLKQNISYAMLFTFRQMIKKHSNTLIGRYGIADARSMRDYMRFIIEGESEENGGIEIINGFFSRIIMFMQDTDGITMFFRQHNSWVPSLQKYILDLIPQKIVSGDLSFTVRSIGASVGKEAYSIASVLESALKKYASDIVYAGIKKQSEKDTHVNNWVDSWDVKVYAVDLSSLRLAIAKEGAYTIRNFEYAVLSLGKGFEKSFSEITKIKGNSYYISANQRLRRWLIPVCCDIDDDLGLIRDIPAEITFSMNLLPYLDYADDLQTAIMQSRRPEYKTYYAYNIYFDNPPQEFHLTSGAGVNNEQPYVIPPSQAPNADMIQMVSEFTGIGSVEGLAKLFGITTAQIDNIINPDGVKTRIPSTIYKRKISEHVVDTMI